MECLVEADVRGLDRGNLPEMRLPWFLACQEVSQLLKQDLSFHLH